MLSVICNTLLLLSRLLNTKLFVVQVYNIYTKAGTMINVDKIIERKSLQSLQGLVAQVDTKDVDVLLKNRKRQLSKKALS